MTSTPRTPAKAPRQATVASPAALLALAHPFFEAQRAQWEALLSWQRSLATFNEDFWEQWAVHYAGGVPIDG